MLLKALMSTLVLTSSIATAQPYEPSDHEDSTRDSRAGLARGQFRLASDVRLIADRQASFIRIDPRARVSRVRLELTNGRAYIDSVFVMHADGRQVTLPVRQMISPRMPRLVIDLRGRDITGVAINSSQMRSARGGGGYRSMHAATVNVIGLRR